MLARIAIAYRKKVDTTFQVRKQTEAELYQKERMKFDGRGGKYDKEKMSGWLGTTCMPFVAHTSLKACRRWSTELRG